MWAGGGIKGGIVALVDTHKIIVKELDIRGNLPDPLRLAHGHPLRRHRAGIEMESLVSHVFSLENWHEGFNMAASTRMVAFEWR
ncbi:MAG: hypothetical protein MZV63_03540 [Marinilabiliales bacterium]|nr:hypothetical protein [Marinilabiliales bacterium]